MCLCTILLSSSCSGEERGAHCCENENDLPVHIERLEFHGKMSEYFLFTVNMLLRIRLFCIMKFTPILYTAFYFRILRHICLTLPCIGKFVFFFDTANCLSYFCHVWCFVSFQLTKWKIILMCGSTIIRICFCVSFFRSTKFFSDKWPSNSKNFKARSI